MGRGIGIKMKILFSLLIFTFSISAMEFQFPPMDLEEKVALLDAFRCGTLKAEQNFYFPYGRPIAHNQIYSRPIAQVSEYFNETLDYDVPLDTLLKKANKAIFSDPRTLDWQPLSLKKKESLSRALFILELNGKLGEEPFEEFRASLLNALNTGDCNKLNSILKRLREIRNSELALPIEKILDPGEELFAIE